MAVPKATHCCESDALWSWLCSKTNLKVGLRGYAGGFILTTIELHLQTAFYDVGDSVSYPCSREHNRDIQSFNTTSHSYQRVKVFVMMIRGWQHPCAPFGTELRSFANSFPDRDTPSGPVSRRRCDWWKAAVHVSCAYLYIVH
jgi:hypothetical protein